MPVFKCTKNGRPGFKAGETGFCYTGDGAKSKAKAQLQDITPKKVNKDQEPSFLRIAAGLQGNIANKQKLKKTPVWKYPISIEKQYEATLVRYVDIIAKNINELIIPSLPALKLEFDFNKPTFDSIRNDDYTANLNMMLENLRMRLNAELPSSEILAIDIGQKVNKWNNKEWQNILKQVLGIQGFVRDQRTAEILKAFINQNVDLINSLKNESLRKLKVTINAGVTSGKRVETITREIRKNVKVSKKRARLIARDQIGKLNGQLTENSQTSYGITHYFWRDSDDSRVRQTHARNNDKRFSWKKPPIDTGHPGQDYQCRCWADPDFSTVGL